MKERREMQVGDWADAAILFLIGLLLGTSVDGLVQLATTAFWPMAVIIPLLFGGLFLLVLVSEKWLDRLFLIGVRRVNKPKEEGRTPLLRLLSLPAGVVAGAVLARLGLDTVVLGWLP